MRPFNFPLYIKSSQIIIGVFVFFYILYLGQDIVLPFTFSVLLAILLNPVVNFMVRHNLNRIVSIVAAILGAMIITFGVIFFVSSQVSRFGDALPGIKEKLGELTSDIIDWASAKLHISAAKAHAWVNAKTREGMNNNTVVIGRTVNTITRLLLMIFLIPVYIFLFLFYKPLLLTFISKLFPKESHATVVEILEQIKGLIQSYLIGLLIEAFIVAALTAIGLFCLGVDYPLLLGVITALLNTIPYIGGIVSISIPTVLALVNNSPTTALLVIALYAVVQFIDNNFLVPKIVSSKVEMNALISIIVVLIGNGLFGIPGMFLAIPVTAIVKVICDRIEPLYPLGFLLGDEMPSSEKTIFKSLKASIKK